MADGIKPSIVDEDDTFKLLCHFVKTSHRIKSPDIRGETVMEMCSVLFARDYKFTIIPNMQGELCGHYPMKLVLMEYEREAPAEDEEVESQYDALSLVQMIKYAKCARCRSRFVMPVILFEGKHVCRSATLSGAAEMFGRSTKDYLLSRQTAQEMGRTDMFSKFRGHDIDLLKFFDVGYICDLMVEKKKTKFKMAITSSEKADKENRYSDFSILQMPYPGCELFKDWKANMYNGYATVYDWALAFNDSDLDLPKSPIVDEVKADWHRYREWSLIELTQNYLKLLLQYLKQGSSGLLIHCISGWDRTPLFVSMLRLSLWADGAIHKSLSATEILYLTLAYDWYLFGHDLPDRLRNEQEIMHFCFKVLQDISSDEFSISPGTRSPTASMVSPPMSPRYVNRASQRGQSLTNHDQLPAAAVKPPGVKSPPRVNSDCSLGLQGVLLTEDMMNCNTVGSTTSLTSSGRSSSSSSSSSSNNVCAADDAKTGDKDWASEMMWEARGGAEGSDGNIKQTGGQPVARSIHRGLSQSPPNQFGSWVDASPVVHTSPGNAEQAQNTEGRAMFINSNHFVDVPLVNHSSPVSVPRRKTQERVGSVNSLGSWQVINTEDHVKSLERSNSQGSPAQRPVSPIASCNEAFAINMSTLRCQRLDAVSRLFYAAYYSALNAELGEGWQEPGGAGAGALSSLFNSFAEQVGLKSSR
ncbi:myotubularin-related protein 14 [Plakobranchus ocellatus]|uniref:Myotubularin-related protein 14 n=1 Tax=Plakobranchus ocellatus TaxID=259542 RepID=A0AAV3Z2M3_9GAST|nr:myotubularin-related protein 14 [Plakobranchus ocellatus]